MRNGIIEAVWPEGISPIVLISVIWMFEGVRANRYISALEQQRYIKGTNILEPEAFLALVKAYLNARDKGLTQCALLSVDTKENDRDEVGKRLIKLLRQSDYVGELEGGKMQFVHSDYRDLWYSPTIVYENKPLTTMMSYIPKTLPQAFP